MPPAVAMPGEMELMKGRGAQTPQDEKTSAKDIASRHRPANLGMTIFAPFN